jgi:hypothetical protein
MIKNYFKLRLFFVFVLCLSVAVGNTAAADKSCANLQMHWTKIPGVIKPVKGYLVPNGQQIIKFVEFETVQTLPEGYVLLTEEFFQNMKLPIPKGAIEVELGTYSYYLPNSPSDRAGRGSGRGHILMKPLDPKQTIEFKGSGTNSYFSAANAAKFNPKDFRRNGLALLDELVQESILGKILENAGVPISSHFEIRLMPDFIQDLVMKNGDYAKAAVQVTRIMNAGRESLYPGVSALPEQKMKLIGRMYAMNASLGAINPENMTFGAKLLDLGHATVGYPLVSGAYRCTLCKWMDGSSMDGTLVGFFDHYYEALPTYEQLKMFKDLERDAEFYFHDSHSETGTIKGFLSKYPKYKKQGFTQKMLETERYFDKMIELVSHFDDYSAPSHLGKLSRKEEYEIFIKHNFRTEEVSYINMIPDKDLSLFIDELTWFKGSSQELRLNSDESVAIEKVIKEKMELNWDFDYKIFSSYVLGKKIPDNLEPERVSISFRSLMQFAGLKKHLSVKEYQEMKVALKGIFADDVQKDADVLMNLFERVFEKSDASQLAFLYQEYLPSNLILADIRKSLKGVSSSKEAARISKELIEKHSQGFAVDPKTYFDALKKSIIIP